MKKILNIISSLIILILIFSINVFAIGPSYSTKDIIVQDIYRVYTLAILFLSILESIIIAITMFKIKKLKNNGIELPPENIKINKKFFIIGILFYAALIFCYTRIFFNRDKLIFNVLILFVFSICIMFMFMRTKKRIHKLDNINNINKYFNFIGTLSYIFILLTFLYLNIIIPYKQQVIDFPLNITVTAIILLISLFSWKRKEYLFAEIIPLISILVMCSFSVYLSNVF